MMKLFCVKCNHVFDHKGVKEKFNSAIYEPHFKYIATVPLAKRFATNIETRRLQKVIIMRLVAHTRVVQVVDN